MRCSCAPDSSLSARLTICSAGIAAASPRCRWPTLGPIQAIALSVGRKSAPRCRRTVAGALRRARAGHYCLVFGCPLRREPRPASAGDIGRPTLGPIAGIEVTVGHRAQLRTEADRHCSGADEHALEAVVEAEGDAGEGERTRHEDGGRGRANLGAEDVEARAGYRGVDLRCQRLLPAGNRGGPRQPWPRYDWPVAVNRWRRRLGPVAPSECRLARSRWCGRLY